MIMIYKDKQDIPLNMEYIELNDVFFNQNTVSRIDERAEKVIETIDEAKLIGKYKICSRFNEVALDIDRLSVGCKTILNVLYYPDKVFCLKECENNALEVLYGLEDGYVCSDYAMIPFDMDSVVVQTKTGKKGITNGVSTKIMKKNVELLSESVDYFQAGLQIEKVMKYAKVRLIQNVIQRLPNKYRPAIFLCPMKATWS